MVILLILYPPGPLPITPAAPTVSFWTRTGLCTQWLRRAVCGTKPGHLRSWIPARQFVYMHTLSQIIHHHHWKKHKSMMTSLFQGDSVQPTTSPSEAFRPRWHIRRCFWPGTVMYCVQLYCTQYNVHIYVCDEMYCVVTRCTHIENMLSRHSLMFCVDWFCSLLLQEKYVWPSFQQFEKLIQWNSPKQVFFSPQTPLIIKLPKRGFCDSSKKVLVVGSIPKSSRRNLEAIVKVENINVV